MTRPAATGIPAPARYLDLITIGGAVRPRLAYGWETGA